MRKIFSSPLRVNTRTCKREGEGEEEMKSRDFPLHAREKVRKEKENDREFLSHNRKSRK